MRRPRNASAVGAPAGAVVKARGIAAVAHLIFGANPALGFILIPIMVYHPLQLAICGVPARHWAARTSLPVRFGLSLVPSL